MSIQTDEPTTARHAAARQSVDPESSGLALVLVLAVLIVLAALVM
ncbi:hypothetical protein [Nocardioides jejuensis]|nr:hypothetical protein [Nocardioides jejuensis]